MRIFKYPAPIADLLSIEMPAKAKVLTVQLQRGEPQIWALVDDDGSLVPREFRWVGTGRGLGEPLGEYVGTLQIEGDFVFHLFELAP
jgi:hypothetical protein